MATDHVLWKTHLFLGVSQKLWHVSLSDSFVNKTGFVDISSLIRFPQRKYLKTGVQDDDAAQINAGSCWSPTQQLDRMFLHAAFLVDAFENFSRHKQAPKLTSLSDYVPVDIGELRQRGQGARQAAIPGQLSCPFPRRIVLRGVFADKTFEQFQR